MWFGVSILSKSLHALEQPKAPLWEESIVIVEADSEEHAVQLATPLGQSQQTSFSVGSRGDTVSWVFDSILEVFTINDESLSSGTEVFSRFLTEDEVLSLKKPFDS